jgi:hypothetical protein
MEADFTRVFIRTKKLLAAIAKKQGMPMHYNSIMICINQMPQLTGEKAQYKLNDLDDEKIFNFFIKHTMNTLFDYARGEKISKKTFAAFIASLEPELVDTKETPVSFSEDLFSLYDVETD